MESVYGGGYGKRRSEPSQVLPNRNKKRLEDSSKTPKNKKVD